MWEGSCGRAHAVGMRGMQEGVRGGEHKRTQLSCERQPTMVVWVLFHGNVRLGASSEAGGGGWRAADAGMHRRFSVMLPPCLSRCSS